jgi:hypothetical protein
MMLTLSTKFYFRFIYAHLLRTVHIVETIHVACLPQGIVSTLVSQVMHNSWTVISSTPKDQTLAEYLTTTSQVTPHSPKMDNTCEFHES